MPNDKEYVTLDDVARETGIKKGSLYYYLRELDIKTYKFPLNRHAHIARRDMELIREAKDSPWKINEIKSKRQVSETGTANEPDTLAA
jgi:AcrR family transcriptional regulator